MMKASNESSSFLNKNAEPPEQEEPSARIQHEQRQSPQETCQRRHNMTRNPSSSGSSVESLEIAAQPEEDQEEEERIKDVCAGSNVLRRLLWILIQLVCATVLLVADVEGDSIEFSLLLVCLSALTFYLLFFLCGTKKNTSLRGEFRCVDAVSTVLIVCTSIEPEVPFLVAEVLLLCAVAWVVISCFKLCFKHGIVETIYSGINCCYVYKNLQDEFVKEQKEQEAAYNEKLERQIQKLSYLEELAQKHPPRRTPNINIMVV